MSSHHDEIRFLRDRLFDDHGLRITGLRGGSGSRRFGGEIEGAAHLFEHLFTRHRRDDLYRIAETAASLHRIERRHDVQHGQVCVVPSREGSGMSERANRGIAEINRADYLFEFDHDTLRS